MVIVTRIYWIYTWYFGGITGLRISAPWVLISFHNIKNGTPWTSFVSAAIVEHIWDVWFSIRVVRRHSSKLNVAHTSAAKLWQIYIILDRAAEEIHFKILFRVHVLISTKVCKMTATIPIDESFSFWYGLWAIWTLNHPEIKWFIIKRNLEFWKRIRPVSHKCRKL